jgi:nucleoside-diphosphate-sugar epimerase
VRVLVTGASGFVGAHVVRALLEAGHEVAALGRSAEPGWRLSEVARRITRIPGDLMTDSWAGSIRRWRPEACCHLAWYAEPGRYLEARENLDHLAAGIRFLEELAAAGCGRLVMVGTCAEYETRYGLLMEETPTQPSTLYAACKLSLWLVAAQRAAQLGVELAWARLFYLYGPMEDERRMVPALILSLLRGKEFSATAGQQVRDYLHVEDAASGLVSLVTVAPTGVFNVCSGEPVRVADLMSAVSSAIGRPALVRLGALPNRDWEPMFVCGSNGRLREATGWSPRRGRTEGIQSTVEWWRERLAVDHGA